MDTLQVSQGRIVNAMGHPIALPAICEEIASLRAVNADLLAALTAMVALVRDDSKSPRRISACMAAASAAVAKAQP